MTWGGALLAALLIGFSSDDSEAEPSGGARSHTVEIRNFAFSPARLEVAVGDTVLWVNRDAAPHTATHSAGRWDSGALENGARWSRVVAEPGTVPYVCAYHPSMRGELIVRASPREARNGARRRSSADAPLDHTETRENES